MFTLNIIRGNINQVSVLEITNLIDERVTQRVAVYPLASQSIHEELSVKLQGTWQINLDSLLIQKFQGACNCSFVSALVQSPFAEVREPK